MWVTAGMGVRVQISQAELAMAAKGLAPAPGHIGGNQADQRQTQTAADIDPTRPPNPA